MLIKKPADIKSSEITPKEIYLNRRQFMTSASAAASNRRRGARRHRYVATIRPGIRRRKIGQRQKKLLQHR